MNMREILSLGNKGVISLIGAGGKTSLMYSIARELESSGKVLTTTTTKIFMPTSEESHSTVISPISREIIEKSKILLKDYSHLTVGSEYLPSHGKLKGLEPAVLNDIYQEKLFDFIIIEADGAAGKSLKACAPHEPIVPVFSDRIIFLVGLDVVAKQLAEKWVFRSKIFSRVTGLGLMEEITESSVASMLIHDMSSITTIGQDTLKIAFLNKADNIKTRNSGERIADFLESSDSAVFNRIVIGELRAEPVIHQFRSLQNSRIQGTKIFTKNCIKT